MAYSNHNKYVSYPDWFGLKKEQVGIQTSTGESVTYIGDSGGSIGAAGITGLVVTGSGNAVTSGTLDGATIVLNKDLTFLTEDTNTNLWELRLTTDGKLYLYANYDVATLGGVTMYTDGGTIDLPGLYDGIPIDSDTIYWETLPDGNKILKAKFTEDTGVDASEVLGIVANAGYAKQTWVSERYSTIEQVNTSIAELTKYVNDSFVTFTKDEVITGIKTFTNGLKIGGVKLSRTTDDIIYLEGNLVVRGGVTMYALDDATVDSIIDALPPASTSSLGVAKFHPDDFVIDENGFVKIIQQDSGGIDISDLPIASTSTKGIALFNAQHFSVSNGIVDLKTKIQVVSTTPSSFDNNTLYIII